MSGRRAGPRDYWICGGPDEPARRRCSPRRMSSRDSVTRLRREEGIDAEDQAHRAILSLAKTSSDLLSPHPRQRDPEESVAPAHLRPSHRLRVDGELVAQRQVLQCDMAVSAAEEGKQSKQAEQKGDHRAESFSGSAPPDQSLGAGRNFGEGQVTATTAHQEKEIGRGWKTPWPGGGGGKMNSVFNAIA